MPVLGVVVNNKDLGRLDFTKKDTDVLRRLGERRARIVQQDIRKKKRDLWVKHNRLEKTRPPIFFDCENGWDEIITEYECETPLARAYEKFIRKELFWGEQMGDDRVTDKYIDAPYIYTQTYLGLPVEILGGQNGTTYTWKPAMKDYSMISELRPQVITVDYEKSERLLQLLRHTFDGIAEIRRHTNWWWSLGMTREMIFFRGMQQYFLDLYDYPDEVKQVMAFLRDSNLKKLDFLEANGLLATNANDTYIGAGAIGYSDEIEPCDDQGKVSAKNMWGFLESQETSTVSADMFEEFVFQFQLPILERFALNCYGCCEPLERRWHIIKRIPNLRRVSVSPWADPYKMAECLEDKYIYSYKPNPSVFALEKMDIDQARKDLKRVMDAAKGCHLEIIMKDTNTVGKDPRNVIDWCRMAREVTEQNWC